MLSVSDAVAGKRVLLTGSTGFLGKVTLSMLLHRYGEVLGRVWVLVRRGSATSAEARFVEKVVRSDPFQPLRDAPRRRGGGDVRPRSAAGCWTATSPTRSSACPTRSCQALAGQVDVVVNCAGPRLLQPIAGGGSERSTPTGCSNAVELCRRLGVPRWSTCPPPSWRATGAGWSSRTRRSSATSPRKGELDGRDFSLEQRARRRGPPGAAAARAGRGPRPHLRASASGRSSGWRRRAATPTTRRPCASRWVASASCGSPSKLTEAGMERARHWGWPNTYTYTKSLGEQVIAGTPDLRYAIVRPSIVESALRFPFPGWNEGFTTSAPLAFAGLKGHRAHPRRRAGHPRHHPRGPGGRFAHRHHRPGALPLRAAASTSRPRATRTRSTPRARSSWWGSTAAGYYRERETGNALLNDVQSRARAAAGVEAAASSPARAPLFAKPARACCAQGIEDHGPRWGAPRVSALLERAREQLDGWRSRPARSPLSSTCSSPSSGRTATSSAATTRASLYAGMAPARRGEDPLGPEGIDWRRYFLEVHLPGLEKWVFPGLEEESEKRKAIHAHRDLLELFEAAVHAYRHRVAFRTVEDEREERFTYGEVHRWRGAGGQLPPPERGEARRPGAARLREPARVGHRLLRHPARRRHRGSGGPGARARPRSSTSPAAAEARVVPALRGGGAGPARAVAHAVRRSRWPGHARDPCPGDGGRPRAARAHRGGAEARHAGRRGLAHLHLRAPPARRRA